MKVRIEDNCTACGLCMDTCPGVFSVDDDKARILVKVIPSELEETVQQAVDECPVEAISVD